MSPWFWRRPPAPPPPAEPDGFVLGRRLWGEAALPIAAGNAVVTPDALVRQLIVCGASGSGKTETSLRLAHEVAKRTDARIFYVDGKADEETAERFIALMSDTGRAVRVFPNEPFDAWRGDAHDLQNRLIEIVEYAQTGSAAFYRDVAKACLDLACNHPDGPPRSSRQLLERLDLKALRQAHRGSTAAAALTADNVGSVRLRYEAFFSQMRGTLDGEWAWDDVDAAYLLLPMLGAKEEARGAARLLFEDFNHYFSARKPREQLCVMFVDEFSALAERSGMAGRVEQARGANTALILCPQAVAGMGDAGERARLLGSVEAVICHRLNTPDEIVELAGTRRAPVVSTHFEDGVATGERTVRLEEQPKIDANEIRALPRGTAFVVSCGKAMKVRVERAPEVRGPLPPATDPPPRPQPPPVPDLGPLPY
jgi:hypothetical protein